MVAKRLEEQVVWNGLHPNAKRGFLAVKENVTIKDGIATTPDGKDVTHLIDVTTKVTDKQVRGLQAVDELSAHEIENGGFIVAFFKQSRTIVDRFPSLTQADTARLMFIGTYIQYEEGRLVYDNGVPMKRKGLAKIVGMSDRRFKDLYERFVAEGILQEDKETGDIFVNPSVFYRGELKKIGYDVSDYQRTRLFRKTVRNLYEQFNGRKLGQLGLVYAILPFIHHKTNVVCFNPEERIAERLRPMTVSKLALVLEYGDAHKLKTAMNGIRVEGVPAFLFVEDVDDRREKRIIVNHNILFAAGNAELQAIKLLFKSNGHAL